MDNRPDGEPVISPDGTQFWDGSHWQPLPTDSNLQDRSPSLEERAKGAAADSLGSVSGAAEPNATYRRPVPEQAKMLYWATRSPQVFVLGALVVIAMFAALGFFNLMTNAGGVPVSGSGGAECSSGSPADCSSDSPGVPPTPTPQASVSTSSKPETPASPSGSPSPTRWAYPSPGNSSLADVASLEATIAPRMLSEVEFSFNRMCNELPNYADQYLAAANWRSDERSGATEGMEAAMLLLGFEPGPVDGYWTPQTTQAFTQLRSALGLSPNGKFSVRDFRRFQGVACWNERGDGLFEFWVDVWPAGLTELSSAGSAFMDQARPSPTVALERLERLWNSSSDDFRLAQCRMWRNDPGVFAADSLISGEALGDTGAVDDFMSRKC